MGSIPRMSVQHELSNPNLCRGRAKYGDYSILDNDDVTQDDHSVPAIIADLATHRVLDQFSITAATLITQHAQDDDTMEQLLQQFIRQVKLDVDTLATHLRPNDGH